MLDLHHLLRDIDLVTLVQETGSLLRPTGSGWRGHCPLHNGRNTSAFVVYEGTDGRQRWHCHADCGEGGDALDFVRCWTGLPDDPQGFWAAAERLAEHAGRPLSAYLSEVGEGPTTRPVETAARSLLCTAAAHYQHALQQSQGRPARAYAKRRGWTDAIMRRYLGYSTGRLRASLQQQEADLDLALEIGLLRKLRDGRLVDAIPPGYLIYLHHDATGSPCYLSGRSISSDEAAQKARNLCAPKQLFYVPPRASAPLVIVEGQADALTAHQWGFAAVALCGSALSARDAQQLRRYRPCYLALDADAASRIATVATALGPLTRIVPSPPGHKDLNAWHQVAGTAEDFTTLLAQAEPWIEVALNAATRAPLHELAAQLEQLALLVAALPTVLQERYLARICDEHALTSRVAFAELLAEYAPQPSHRFTQSEGGLVVNGRLISNFFARITSERVDESGTRYLTIKGRMGSGEPLPEIELEAVRFERGQWALGAWGRGALVYLAPGKRYLLAQAIQAVSA